jgi:hypothetical protein
MGWTVQASDPDGGESYHTRINLPWGHSSLLYTGYWVFFQRQIGQGVVLSTYPILVPRLWRSCTYTCTGMSWGDLYPLHVTLHSSSANLSFTLNWIILVDNSVHWFISSLGSQTCLVHQSVSASRHLLPFVDCTDLNLLLVTIQSEGPVSFMSLPVLCVPWKCVVHWVLGSLHASLIHQLQH